MKEAKIQALVDCGLLRPKAEVEWKAPTGGGVPDGKCQGTSRLQFLL
jgi:hypothetical protein